MEGRIAVLPLEHEHAQRPGAALGQAMALGEDIRRHLASCKLVNLETGEDYGTLTLSIGVAQYCLGEPTGAFVRRAELALRQAKLLGRNRVLAEGLATTEIAGN